MDTIVTRIEHAAKGQGTVTFMTGDEPVAMTWAELHADAKKMAAALQTRGVNHGDHVAVLGPTTINLVTAMQAVWLCGATLVVLPLPMRLACTGGLHEVHPQSHSSGRLGVCVGGQRSRSLLGHRGR